MIGIDTNVLLRCFIDDEPAQAAAARRLLELCERRREPVFVSTTALSETLWVLQSRYRRSRAELLDLVEHLLEIPVFRLESADAIRAALIAARSHKGSLTDHLIGHIGLANGCSATATFDAGLHSAPGFRRL